MVLWWIVVAACSASATSTRGSLLVLRCVLDLLDTRAAINAVAGVKVGLGLDELRRRLRIVVEMLHDNAVLAQRQVQHVARLPRMLHAVEQRVAAPLEDVHH